MGMDNIMELSHFELGENIYLIGSDIIANSTDLENCRSELVTLLGQKISDTSLIIKNKPIGLLHLKETKKERILKKVNILKKEYDITDVLNEMITRQKGN